MSQGGQTPLFCDRGDRPLLFRKMVLGKKKPVLLENGFILSSFTAYFVSGAPAFAGTTLTFFCTKPLLRQRVQILRVTVVPSISVFTFNRFGLHVRRE